MSDVTFADLGLAEPLLRALNAANYTHPTPIQARTIPALLQGRDVLGIAQTGTGKTAAFALPVLQHLSASNERAQPRSPRALVLAPTRELAVQIARSFDTYGRGLGLKLATVVGGLGYGRQIETLARGVDILVATPGRLLDLVDRGNVKLGHVTFFVLDEADRMFDMGFIRDVRRIATSVSKNRQTLLFSATMPQEIRSLAMEMLKRPVTVEIGASRPVESVRQVLCAVEQEGKYDMLLSLLQKAGEGQTLVFTRTKHRAKKLAIQLSRASISATSLQGNLSQGQRQTAMDGFRSGRVQVMVATDIAARGIDVSQISHVINYDVPDTADAYTHRIGRTGRMSRLGTAYTLATQEDTQMIRSIERLLGRPPERMNGSRATSPSAQPAKTETRPAAALRPQTNPGRRNWSKDSARTRQ